MSTSERRLCEECGHYPALGGSTKCEPCRQAYIDAIHRRREAELRLPPLRGSIELEPSPHLTMDAPAPLLLRAVNE